MNSIFEWIVVIVAALVTLAIMFVLGIAWASHDTEDSEDLHAR